MVDQRFHVVGQLLLGRRHHLGVVRHQRPLGHAFQRLHGNAPGLAHLGDPHQIPVQNIAPLAHGNLEVELLIARVGLVLADVIRNAAGPEQRPRDAERIGLLDRHGANALRAPQVDGVVREQFLVLVHAVGEGFQKIPAVVIKRRVGLARDAAHPEIARHHADAGDFLENLQELLALPEAIEKDGHRAQIERVGAEPDQVAVQARHLGEQHAQVLTALGNLHVQEFLDRQDEAQVVRHGRQIVHAVGHGESLVVGLLLHVLLDAGVQVADDGLAGEHRLAVEFEHHAQNPVGARVLRPHVERHGLGLDGTEHVAVEGVRLPGLRGHQRLLIPIPPPWACPRAYPGR